MAVGGAQAEILGDPAAPLFQHIVERGAEAVAIERMQHVEPLRRRAFQRAHFETERGFGLGAGENLVGGDVPIQIMSPAPVSANARRSTSDTMPWVIPPAKACCITVKPISMTIRMRPPSSAGATMSLVKTPVTAKPAAITHTTSRSQVGMSRTAR